uniref:Peptidase M1 leukotriene A4 hydrolase/aminopeptidase C-terminal domain-containing protein n=1 Tax=Arion vulgaris TaxID=1028688 RepID=A0A0B6ZWX3_9EUPU
MGLHSDNVQDVASASNFKDVKTTHIHLDLTVSFSDRLITAWTELSLVSHTDDLRTVSLDSHHTLTINEVRVKNEGNAEFSIEPFADYGTHLVITLPALKQKGDKFVLEISHGTSSGPGVCWLDPPQTADKVKPFLYTQGQSVLNRSFFPCQDTPAVKATYSAVVTVPDGFTAIMSANNSSFGKTPNRLGDPNCFFFEQTVPIQSYLVALAVGDLKSAKIGPRSHVWAEPSVLDRAQAEFDGVVEDFILTGESLFGEYVWGRYDILIMPPSFPYGGMENPCLTFVTPCIIVGDKSLTDVVIHEITHSWFGNLVTNANWSEFWLNEGFTMFGQRRIEEKLYGRPAMCLEAATGQSLLRRHIQQEGNDSPLTKLRVIIDKGVDPDDTYNETPYEKGFSFVSYLQHLVGDVDKFDEFLRDYIQTFKFKSIVAEDFIDYFLNYFPTLKEQNVHEKPGFEFVKTWLNTPGWPPYSPDLSAHGQLTEPAKTAADLFSIKHKLTSLKDNAAGIENWGTYKTIYFLDLLAERSPLAPEFVQQLITHCPFLSTSNNSEVKLRWCELVIKNDIQDKFQDIRQFLHSQGKQKYTKPTYQQMMKGSQSVKEMAVQVFHETKSFLHTNVREYVTDILKEGGCL